MESKQTKAVLLIATTVMLCGFLGLCSRALHEFSFGPGETSFSRSLITTVGLVVIILLMDRRKFRVRPRDLLMFAVFGAFKLFSDLLLFASQDRISLGLATLLQMTAPFYVLVLSYYLFREKITYGKIVAMFAAFFGLMLVCDIFSGFSSVSYFGMMCGIASGFFFALYMVGGKVAIDKGYDPFTVILYVFLFSLVFNIPAADTGAVLSALVIPKALGYMLFLGLLLTLLPYLVDAWATGFMPPSLVAMIGSLEAVAAAVVGLLFYGETVSLLNAAGMAIVILSVCVLNIHVVHDHGSSV